MKRVYIEFAHIYQDERFGEEQIKSILLLKKVIKQLENENKPYITSVLIDDFHVKSETWNLEYFLENVKEHGVIPDLIAFEKRFDKVAEKTIQMIPEKNKKTEYFRKQKKHVLFFDNGIDKFALKDVYNTHNEYKCVILSCAWLLCKLGKENYPENSIINSISGNAETGEVVSILSKRYQKTEDNVLKILSSVGLETEKEKVSYIYY